MSALTDSYLEWQDLAHASDCARPSWTVDTRIERTAFRTVGGTSHVCPVEECEHSGRYTRTSLRIVCTSCGIALVMTGDDSALRNTSTAELGYGQPPKKAGGLWMYPGAPLLFGWGHGEDSEPEGYLVTRTRVARVTADNLIGAIYKDRGPRRGVRWSATAVPDPKGEYGYGQTRWARAISELRSATAAAKWIAAQGGESA
ncbi:hypothetical protein [Streptomyces californicus]|uniref:hypothetical protein n=1 Tax=Streptomyces californicus TaxID=67351 RepID=UPI0037FC8898